jgi:hypothetical protein
MLDDTHIDAVFHVGPHQFIDVFQFNLNGVDQSLYHSFFDPKKLMFGDAPEPT